MKIKLSCLLKPFNTSRVNSRRKHGIILPVISLGFLYLASCSYSQQKDEMQSIVRLKPQEASRCCLVNKPVILEVGVKNTSTKAGNYVQEGHILQYFEFTVIYENNAPVPMTQYGKFLSKHSIPGTGARPLKPQEEYTEEVPISRLFDLSMAGKYQIKGRAKSDRSLFTYTWSPMLEVTVRD